MVTCEYMKNAAKAHAKNLRLPERKLSEGYYIRKIKKVNKKVLYPKMQDPKEPESIAEDIYLLTDEKCGNLIRNDLIFRKE